MDDDMTTTKGTNGARPTPPKAAVDQHNWQAEAQFWQLKYFEQLLHSTQVITALGRPMLVGVQQLQQQAQAAAQAAAGLGLQ
jgi:hypothetical protein